jgi:D-alanine-D-alanine ligase
MIFSMGGKKIKVGILFGGKSGEHEVSIVSATSVYKALDKNKYDVTMIGIDKTGRWLLPSETQELIQSSNPRLFELNKQRDTVSFVPFEAENSLVSLSGKSSSNHHFDVIIPVLHGTYGEDGTIQGLLELANVAYVGSGVLGSSVGMDKDVSRRLLAHAGIPVVPTMTLRHHDFIKSPKEMMQKIVAELGLPFFIKPANAGSSVGVHKVKSIETAMAQFEDAFSFDRKVLAEKSVSARELEVSVLGNHHPKASIVGEIIPNHEFYTYEAKYIDANGADLKIPAENVSPEMTKKIQDMAIAAFQTLELRGLSRVDFFLDRHSNELFLNEVNTIPGFTSISMYPKLWAASGINYADLLDELIRLAMELHREKNSLKTQYDT